MFCGVGKRSEAFSIRFELFQKVQESSEAFSDVQGDSEFFQCLKCF